MPPPPLPTALPDTAAAAAAAAAAATATRHGRESLPLAGARRVARSGRWENYKPNGHTVPNKKKPKPTALGLPPPPLPPTGRADGRRAPPSAPVPTAAPSPRGAIGAPAHTHRGGGRGPPGRVPRAPPPAHTGAARRPARSARRAPPPPPPPRRARQSRADTDAGRLARPVAPPGAAAPRPSRALRRSLALASSSSRRAAAARCFSPPPGIVYLGLFSIEGPFPMTSRPDRHR